MRNLYITKYFGMCASGVKMVMGANNFLKKMGQESEQRAVSKIADQYTTDMVVEDGHVPQPHEASALQVAAKLAYKGDQGTADKIVGRIRPSKHSAPGGME